MQLYLDKVGNARVGRCYELSFNYVTRNNPDAILVHGVIYEPGGDRSVNHAWVELPDGNAYDPVLDWNIPIEAYYALFKASPERKYTEDEVIQHAISSGHKGPWHNVSPENDKVHP